MNRPRAAANSWKTRPMPPEHKVLPVEGMVSRDEFVTISHGRIPRTPADKWFIYLDSDNLLHFHRSQTGTCIYQLQLEPFEDRYAMTKAVVNREPSQYRNTDDSYDVSLIAYLIDTVLLGRFAPFPQLRGLSTDDQQRHQQHVMGSGGRDGGDSIQLKMMNGNP